MFLIKEPIRIHRLFNQNLLQAQVKTSKIISNKTIQSLRPKF